MSFSLLSNNKHMNSEDPNPDLETIRGYFPVLTTAEQRAAREYGILSFDGNDKTTDEDLLCGMSAAADIARRTSGSAHAAGLI